MLTVLVLAVILLAGAATVTGGALLWNSGKSKELPPTDPPKQLGDGATNSIERNLDQLRPGDVVQHDTRDYVVEGVLRYEDDGAKWLAGRLVDVDREAWLFVNPQEPMLMELAPAPTIEGYPPDFLTHDNRRYTMAKRGTASVYLRGHTGLLPGQTPSTVSSVLRCRYWNYESPGGYAIVVEQWGDSFRVFRGKAIAEGMLELLGGS